MPDKVPVAKGKTLEAKIDATATKPKVKKPKAKKHAKKAKR